jgi:penicillin-binding protein A
MSSSASVSGPQDDARLVRRRRARAVIALAAVAFAAGAIVGAEQSSPSAAHEVAARFAAAWARGDYAAMYAEISPASQRAVPVGEFADAYLQAGMLATASDLRVVGEPHAAAGGLEVVPVRVRTRLFGTLSSSFALPISGQGEAGDRVRWSSSLAFPGLQPGERLSRRTALPPRASLLARDGSVLAEGPATAAGQRSSPLGAAAGAVVGEVGPIPQQRRQALESEGVPADAIVGVSGLELADDDRLRGTPGGELLADRSEIGERVLASAIPHADSTVATTISPAVQSAVVSALGGQYGGIVALAPHSGQILAVAGIGLDALQPPGSTFKMVTVSAVLQAGLASPSSTFPYQTAATLDGVALHNANGESCGGTLVQAFAQSCNSVFAPLGVKLGAARLVAAAERFGFNHDTQIAGAASSTIPPASQIQGELAVGSTAIGQDRVQASALEMAIVAATIADGGRRPTPSFTTAPDTSVRAIGPATARAVRGLMIDVVRFGTGTAAAIPEVTVAGKTGTAELDSPKTCSSSSQEEAAAGAAPEQESQAAGESNCQDEQSDPQNTDAWFAAFAPAVHPRIAVGVLLVRDGAGGATAAPVARQVLEAGLRASRPG